MQTTEDERQWYLRVANDLEFMNLQDQPLEQKKVFADFLRCVIADVGRLERELRSVLPLYTSEGCWYCYNGTPRDSDLIHSPSVLIDEHSRVYNECLYHPKYAGARAVLGIPDKPAACVTCGKPGTM